LIQKTRRAAGGSLLTENIYRSFFPHGKYFCRFSKTLITTQLDNILSLLYVIPVMVILSIVRILEKIRLCGWVGNNPPGRMAVNSANYQAIFFNGRVDKRQGLSPFAGERGVSLLITCFSLFSQWTKMRVIWCFGKNV